MANEVTPQQLKKIQELRASIPKEQVQPVPAEKAIAACHEFRSHCNYKDVVPILVVEGPLQAAAMDDFMSMLFGASVKLFDLLRSVPAKKGRYEVTLPKCSGKRRRAEVVNAKLMLDGKVVDLTITGNFRTTAFGPAQKFEFMLNGSAFSYDTAWEPAATPFWTRINWEVSLTWLRGGEILGFKYDATYPIFKRFIQSSPVSIDRQDWSIMVQWPNTFEYEGQQLHNESGPAVEFNDGFKVWSINGITVNEQIVMHPEMQTVEQISQEPDNDLRSIRMQRFGMTRYARESGAKCLDKRQCPVSNTWEALMKFKNGDVFLFATCQTGAVQAIPVDPKIKTCKGAQEWMRPERAQNMLGAT